MIIKKEAICHILPGFLAKWDRNSRPGTKEVLNGSEDVANFFQGQTFWCSEASRDPPRDVFEMTWCQWYNEVSKTLNLSPHSISLALTCLLLRTQLASLLKFHLFQIQLPLSWSSINFSKRFCCYGTMKCIICVNIHWPWCFWEKWHCYSSSCR